jgi:LDH2 family malate/lactate/ureidoglycolate dehydrogenase
MNDREQPEGQTILVSVPSLRGFAQALLQQAGMPADDAEVAAQVIIDANLRGVDTHIEFTTSLFMGTQWGPHIVRWSEDFDHSVSLAHYVQALDIHAFVSLDEYRQRVDDFCTALKAIPPVEGVDGVLLPGEPELRTAQARMVSGCPLTAHTVQVLAELGVPFTLRDGH